MPPSGGPTGGYRFGTFEIDPAAGELRKAGLRIRLQEQPLQALCVLLENAGAIVTREQLQSRLWPAGTHVEYDNSLNATINRVREALGDSAESPRFIETIPRRGYRFLAPVEAIPGERRSGVDPADTVAPARPRHWRRRAAPYVAAAGVILLATLLSRLPPFRNGSPSEEADSRTRMVVLPFDNLSGDPSREYFSDGLTEEMIAQLGRLNPARLGVIARTSALRYKGSDLPIERIGSELEVDYVLEGSVRYDSDHLRVTAKLIQVEDETQLWSATYDRELADVLAIQSEVAQQIAGSLALELIPAERERLSRPLSVDPAAYQACLRGRYFWNRRTREGFEQAIGEFERAIAIDDRYAPAHVGIADTFAMLGIYDFLRPKEAFPKAREAAERALAIAPDLAEAHASMALIRYAFDWDWQGAESSIRRAIDLNAGYAPAHQWYASYLSAMGRHDEALARHEEARRLDPLSLIINADLGWKLFFARRMDDAVAALRATIDLDPRFLVAHDNLAWVLMIQGRHDESLEAFATALELGGDPPEKLSEMRRVYREEGMAELWRRGAEGMMRDAKLGYVSPYDIALQFLVAGDRESALDWLERSHREREVDLTMINVDPRLDPVRESPRFRALVRRMGF